MDEGARIREHLAMETEGSFSPSVERTVSVVLTSQEAFCLLDSIRAAQASLGKRPAWLTEASSSALRKLVAVTEAPLVRRPS